MTDIDFALLKRSVYLKSRTESSFLFPNGTKARFKLQLRYGHASFNERGTEFIIWNPFLIHVLTNVDTAEGAKDIAKSLIKWEYTRRGITEQRWVDYLVPIIEPRETVFETESELGHCVLVYEQHKFAAEQAQKEHLIREKEKRRGIIF